MGKKENLFNLIAWGLCTVIAIALLILVISDRRKNQERIFQAQLEAQAQDDDLANAGDLESNRIKKASNVYSELVSRMKFSNFVCLGDNEMSGSSEGSLPKAFGEVANGHLLELLSEPFRDIIEQEKQAVPSMAVFNLGASNEGMGEILVRAGVDELEVAEWALIPGEREPVNIVLRNGNSKSTLHFAKQKGYDFGQAEISGVKGELTKGDGEYDEDHPRIAFIRDRTGDSFQVGMGTNIEIESATKYIGNIPIFFFEDDSADTVDSIDEFVGDLELLVQRYTRIEVESSDSSEELPYVIICTVEEETELDDALKEAFGNHYIRHDTYAYEMTEDGYKELAQKVYANLDGQGSFDEMKEKIQMAANELKAGN